MGTKLYFDFAGLSFCADADMYDDDGQGVEKVNSVKVQDANGNYMPVAVDLDAFKEEMHDWLDEAVKDYLEAVKEDYYENLMDERRIAERFG